jgi:hypothetical protein
MRGTLGWLAPVVMGMGLMSLGGNCGDTPATEDGGAADSGQAAASEAGAEGGDVAATCEGVCACLAAACPSYPFSPDCVTACQDPTNQPVWDLSCRASECIASRADDTHCANATGQTLCH